MSKKQFSFPTEGVPIERKIAPGPVPMVSHVEHPLLQHFKKEDDSQSITAEEEKQLAIAAFKKAIKEVSVTHEGRLNIVTQVDCAKDTLCVKYNEDFEYIAAGCSDGSIRIFPAAGGKQFKLTDEEVNNKRSPVTSIKHRPVSKTYPVTNCFTGTCK